eukprot:TRINITY_DN517_c0_g2_i5.p1 TRINITY_DN517_c0_g2~~TRINITY_DN517_c0_g2_i5.p1  ORF type:complete len:204 (-),score=10.08 TRINITY_DN517_c0_g2_i5:66-677(-)
MIQLNPRVGSKVDLLKPLLELFAAAYAPECMPEIEEVLRNHQSLRDELVNPLPYCGDIKNCEGYITKGKDYLALSAAIFRCVSPSALKSVLCLVSRGCCGGYGECRTPVFFEDVEADVARVVDVGMVDFCLECYFWQFKRIIHWKVKIELEGAFRIERIAGTFHNANPMIEILRVRQLCCASKGWVFCDVVEFFLESFESYEV